MDFKNTVFKNIELPPLKSKGKVVPPSFKLETLESTIDLILEYKSNDIGKKQSDKATKIADQINAGKLPPSVAAALEKLVNKKLPKEECLRLFKEKMTKTQSDIDIINDQLDMIQKDPRIAAAVERDTKQDVNTWVRAKITAVNKQLQDAVSSYEKALTDWAESQLKDAWSELKLEAGVKVRFQKIRVVVKAVATNLADVPKLIAAHDWAGAAKALLKGTILAGYEAYKKWPSVQKTMDSIKSLSHDLDDRIDTLNKTIARNKPEEIAGEVSNRKSLITAASDLSGMLDIFNLLAKKIQHEADNLTVLVTNRLRIFDLQINKLNELEKGLSDKKLAGLDADKARQKIDELREELASRADYMTETGKLQKEAADLVAQFDAVVRERKKQIKELATQKFKLTAFGGRVVICDDVPVGKLTKALTTAVTKVEIVTDKLDALKTKVIAGGETLTGLLTT